MLFQFDKVPDDPEILEEEIKDMVNDVVKVYKLREKLESLVVENSERKTEQVKEGVAYTKDWWMKRNKQECLAFYLG